MYPLTLLICSAGLMGGAVHVWVSVDYMATVMPLAYGHRARAFAAGVGWGLGHSAGIVIIAGIFAIVKKIISLDALGHVAERFVGVMVMGLGVWGMRRALRMRLHVQTHTQDGITYLHLHNADAHESEAEAGSAPLHKHPSTTIGTVQGGLHAWSFVLAVLPAMGMHTPEQAAAYLGVFALGAVLTMAAFAGTLGMSRRGGEECVDVALARRLMACAGGLTIAVGAAWMLLPALGWELP